MGRLHCIILLTPELERQKAFYEQKLGLGVTHDSPEWVGFALRGASLALHAAPAGTTPELQIAITAVPLEPRIEALKARGVVFEGGIEDAPTCRLARLLDPEGNRVQLVEPKAAAVEGQWPRLSRAIVAAKKFASTTHFYRDVLGLRAAEEEDGRVEFATGATRLTIQDRESANSLPLHAEQKIAFAFEDDEFDTWTEELRGRGMSFAAAPMDGEFGVQAEVEDADGWFVVLHGPPPEEPREDELAEDYVDDDEPQQRTQMIRKPGETSGESTKKRLTAAKLARQTSERAATKSFETPRTPREPETGGFGGGSGGSRPDRGGFTGGGARPSGPPRPGGYSGGSRPGGPSGPGGPPRPGGFGGGAPRPGGPGGAPGPGGPPRPGGYGGGGPRPGGPGGPSGPRPGGFGSGGPRPGGPGGSGGPRPGGSGGPRPGGSGPRPGGPRPDRGGSGGSGGTGGSE